MEHHPPALLRSERDTTVVPLLPGSGGGLNCEVPQHRSQHNVHFHMGESGTDAAPYFRIFNPQSQSEKFDPTGAYIRKYVGELGDLEGKTIHVPGADGRATYAAPMVNHSAEREESLSRYKAVSGK